jgi:uncharacterized membrane protein
MQKINTVQVLKDAWTKVKPNFWVITNAILLAGLVFFTTNLFANYAETKGPILSLFSFALTMISESFMMFALIKFFLDIYYDKEATILGMFQNNKKFYKFFVLYTALNLATLAGIIFLAVPAIYVILTYSFATYILLDQNLDINASIKESEIITKGYKMELFKFWFWLLILNILGGVFFLVGLVVTLPLTILAIIEVYKMLSTRISNDPQ